jgi:prepilin-type N-terminal cleavage/methylation domain-containing protein
MLFLYFCRRKLKEWLMMVKLKKENGFSLVEVILAISILLIVVAAFTLLFTTSFSGIFTAGRKSKSLFEAQELVDNLIGGDANYQYDSLLVIEFDQRTIAIEGEEISVEYQYEDRYGDLNYFLPK